MQSVARPSFLSRFFSAYRSVTKNAGAGSPNRVTEGNGTAIDVDFIRIEVQLTADFYELSSKRFVGFDEVKVLDFQTCLERALRLAGIGPMPMMAGSTPAEA